MQESNEELPMIRPQCSEEEDSIFSRKKSAQSGSEPSDIFLVCESPKATREQGVLITEIPGQFHLVIMSNITQQSL